MTPTSLLYWQQDGVPGPGPGPCCTVPHAELTAVQAMLSEFLGTAALLFLCGSVWDPRNAKNSDGIPIKFGLLIAAVAMCLVSMTFLETNRGKSPRVVRFSL